MVIGCLRKFTSNRFAGGRMRVSEDSRHPRPPAED